MIRVGAVFLGEIGECPHATDQHFHTWKAQRVDAIVAMQVLYFLAGTDFDRRDAADSVALTESAYPDVGHLADEHFRMLDAIKSGDVQRALDEIDAHMAEGVRRLTGSDIPLWVA